MIELEVPKDIRKYDAKLFGPFTTRQFICFVIICVVAAGLYFLLRDIVPEGWEDAMYILIIAVNVPLILVGWWKPFGMPFEKFAMTAFNTTFVYPNTRTYMTNNIYSDKIEDDKKRKKNIKQIKKNIKPSKDKNLVAYK